MNGGASGRLYPLDAFRFVAAISVVGYHYIASYVDGALLPGPLRNAPGVARYGYLGVPLFFMISGFVILWSAQGRSATDFAISRVSRLYPAFWVAMLVTALFIIAFAWLESIPATPPVTVARLVANATMVPSLFGATAIDGVYWTLELELRFYALVFLLILTRQVAHLERWLYIWLALCILSYVTTLPWIVSYLTLDPYGPFFIAGGLFYLCYRDGADLSRLLAIVGTAYLAVVASLRMRSDFITPDSISTIVVPLIVAGFFAAFVGLVAGPRLMKQSELLSHLGALTYPLYLVHGAIGRLLIDYLTPLVNVAGALLAATFVTLFIAQMLVVFVDVPARAPMRNMCHRIVRKVSSVLK